MTTARGLADLSEEELLDAAGACAEAIRDAETDLLRLAYEWAIVHPADRLDPDGADRPGRERARQLGGEGTPEVAQGWQVQQPFPGIYLWRDPHGGHDLVDHTGTRQLPNTRRPLVVELWHSPINIQIADDYTTAA